MSAPGSMADQTALLFMLARFERMEFLAKLFDEVPNLQRDADRQYICLLGAAMRCGYEPHARHWDVLCIDWSRQRANAIRASFPNHVAEAERRRAA